MAPAKRIPIVLLALTLLVGACSSAGAQTYAWQPQPAKATLMVISAHPDDEGIFFGGAIPYYSAVRKLPMVHISMTSGDWHRPPEVREAELCAADWAYGMRNPPLFPRFKDYPTSTLAQTWDVWADDQGDIDNDPAEVAAGRLRAAEYVATQIRTYMPEVVIAHDFEGEYGHKNHQASAWAAADAYALAADPTVDLAGLPAWQAKKLCIHLYNRPPAQPMLHELRHDWSTPFHELDGRTALATADDGLACHVSQGGSTLATRFAGRRHSEQWGLYASTVGQDTLDPDGIARGDFFEHIAVTRRMDVLNGGFESVTGGVADHWTEVEAAGGSNDIYFQSGGLTPGATSTYAHFKANGGAWLQQGFSTADIGAAAIDATTFGEYSVDFDFGYRNDAATHGDIVLRFSIWDVSDDAELGGVDFLIADPGATQASNDPLQPSLVTIAYDHTAATPGHRLALRITQLAPDLDTASWQATAILDNVTLMGVPTVVPEPASLALVGIVVVVLRRRRD